jgi:hypothetical protein
MTFMEAMARYCRPGPCRGTGCGPGNSARPRRPRRAVVEGDATFVREGPEQSVRGNGPGLGAMGSTSVRPLPFSTLYFTQAVVAGVDLAPVVVVAGHRRVQGCGCRGHGTPPGCPVRGVSGDTARSSTRQHKNVRIRMPKASIVDVRTRVSAHAGGEALHAADPT